MAVALRLTRIGKKNAPFYRVVAINSRTARDGRALDTIGTIDGIKGEIVCFNVEKIQDWISKGAQMSDTVRKYYKQALKAASK